MCLLVVAIAPHPTVLLVLAANRDEAHDRPTLPARAWADSPFVFGGRDLVAGGTWLGATRAGRVAAITNVRDPSAPRGGRTRGELPRRFLEGASSPEDFADVVAREARAYAGFNLVVADGRSAAYVNERDPAPVRLSSGLYGLSNGRLDDPWPKVVRAKHAMGAAISQAGEVDTELLFAMLRDETPAEDGELPSTGVPLEIERLLAPSFIRNEQYGTRSSTVLVLRASANPCRSQAESSFEERSFGPSGDAAGRVYEAWNVS